MKAQKSLPSLGAWIETGWTARCCANSTRRSLHWERGLKPRRHQDDPKRYASLPSLGAWIETAAPSPSNPAQYVAPFTGSVD